MNIKFKKKNEYLTVCSVQHHAKKTVSNIESYNVFGMVPRNQLVMRAEIFHDLRS